VSLDRTHLGFRRICSWVYERTRLRERDLFTVLLFLGLGVLVARTPPQSDTFFHLRIGRYIWESGTIPLTELFSHTFYSRPWLNHEWLSQLILFGVYETGGPFLLTVAMGLCALAAVLASWKLTQGSDEIRWMLLVALVILTAPEWAVRPQALSLPLLVLAIWLVLRDKMAWLPILTVLWANAHGVVVLGVLIAGVNAIEALLWSRDRVKSAMITAALCVAAPMATPLGWEYWPRVIETVGEARALGVHEYRSAFADISSLPFWLTLAALCGVTFSRFAASGRWNREDRLLVLSSYAVGFGAILSIRNAPSFALLAAPAISRMIRLPRIGGAAPLARSGYGVIGIAVVVVLSVIGFSWRDGGASLGWRPFSPAALHAIRTCRQPIYNEYADGGTLLWFVPEQRVFVDGRIEAYPSDFLRRVREADSSGRYQQLFEEYGVRCAVTRTGSVLARKIESDSLMTVRFTDEQWSVYDW
jgi:hypothetical protein